MKKHIKQALFALAAFALFGCGGGGGGGGGGGVAVGPVTKAATKVFLFGNISASGKVVATVDTTLHIPGGILVNYSSAPGAKTGTFPVRRGVIVPSGPVRISANDMYGDYTVVDGTPGGTLRLTLLNNSRLALKSSISANSGTGIEVATINFNLATPGTTPSSMPVTGDLTQVSQFILLDPGAVPTDTTTKFLTSYQ